MMMRFKNIHILVHVEEKVMIRFDEIKSLCTWCGKYVYKNKKDEFMDRMKGKVNGKI